MPTYEQLMQKLKEEAEEEQARREAMSICPQCGGRLGGPLFGYMCLGKLLPPLRSRTGPLWKIVWLYSTTRIVN